MKTAIYKIHKTSIETGVSELIYSGIYKVDAEAKFDSLYQSSTHTYELTVGFSGIEVTLISFK